MFVFSGLIRSTYLSVQLTISIVIGGIGLTATLPAFYERDLAPHISMFTNQSGFLIGLTDVLRITFIGVPGQS